jgi:AcrR family transcriptional regulator
MAKSSLIESAAGVVMAVDRIVAGARKHFLAHGFRAVTMADLASELGMSKKTLYEHFPSKRALVEAVIAAKFAQAERQLADVAGDAGLDFSARLHALLRCIRLQAEEIQPSFLRDIARETPELFEFVKKQRRRLIHRHFGSLLKEGRAAGMIRKDVPERMMIEFLGGVTDAIVNPPMLGELGLTPKAAFNQILTLFLIGATTDKGRRQL